MTCGPTVDNACLSPSPSETSSLMLSPCRTSAGLTRTLTFNQRVGYLTAAVADVTQLSRMTCGHTVNNACLSSSPSETSSSMLSPCRTSADCFRMLTFKQRVGCLPAAVADVAELSRMTCGPTVDNACLSSSPSETSSSMLSPCRTSAGRSRMLTFTQRVGC